MTVAVQSAFNPLVTVQIDPWGVNPLLEDATQSVAQVVEVARQRNGEPPTMFNIGDFPPFLASGVDPHFLRYLPWQIRHAAAQEPAAAVVLSFVERYATEPDAKLESEGLDDYLRRFTGWLRGSWTNPSFNGVDPEQASAADNALYDSLFGAVEAQRRVQLDALNAQGRAFNQSKASRGLGNGKSSK